MHVSFNAFVYCMYETQQKVLVLKYVPRIETFTHCSKMVPEMPMHFLNICHHCPYHAKSLLWLCKKFSATLQSTESQRKCSMYLRARKRMNWCLFQILNFHWLSVILESCHQNISKQHIARRRHTILLFFEKERKGFILR